MRAARNSGRCRSTPTRAPAAGRSFCGTLETISTSPATIATIASRRRARVRKASWARAHDARWREPGPARLGSSGSPPLASSTATTASSPAKGTSTNPRLAVDLVRAGPGTADRIDRNICGFEASIEVHRI